MGLEYILLSKRRNKMVTNKTLSLFENFNQYTPYAVGFESVFDRLQTYAQNNSTAGFPPYNIQKGGEYNYVIELAVAGFGKDDIEVEVADGRLTVKSVKENDSEDTAIYRGIAFRKFNRQFTLAEDIVVNGATLENGMLSIDLERVVPDEKKPRQIEVK
jgi:molecular chaperone IbpA|tara:strand:- start:142 stop:618 length:477 start_codon:yes stop_codon:yes gene_type:complete